MYGTALEALGIETGASLDLDIGGGAADAVGTIVDWAAGGYQKRERMSRNELAAAEAVRDAALAQVEAARINAGALQTARPAGLLGKLSEPSPFFGQSWAVVGGVAVGAAVVAYLVLA